jgi:hypothetical protein
MKVSLEMSVPSQPAALVEHEGPIVHIGRDPTCELVLDPTLGGVSWRHARLEMTPGGLVAVDLGSTNGTYVNGQRIAGPTVVSMGDTIGLGQRGPRLRLAGLNESGMAKAKSPASKTGLDLSGAAASEAPALLQSSRRGPGFHADSDPRPTMAGVMSTFREPPFRPSLITRLLGPGLLWRIVLIALVVTLLAIAVATFIWLTPS